MRARLIGLGMLFAALLLAGAVAGGPARAQSDAELGALNRRAMELYEAGKYSEALPLSERFAAAIKARYGADHPLYATALYNLALLLRDTNRPAEAESLMRQGLAIDEKSRGPTILG